MKFNLKNLLKTLKLNESTVSMVLGLTVIVTVGILVGNYFKDKGTAGKLPLELNNKTEATNTNFAKSHLVVKGESLWSIAEKEIGSGYNWVDLAKENNLKNPGLIFAGQKMVIPSVEVRIAAQPSTTDHQLSSNLPAISGATYQVVKGDNLWDIAIRAYGDGYKWSEIARENKLVHPNLIHSGNILILPR